MNQQETVKKAIDLLRRYDDQFRESMPSKDYCTVGSLYWLLSGMEVEA